MLDSLILYAAAATTAVAAIRRKPKIAAAGAAAMLVTLAWPASEKRATGTTKLDAAVPVWQFDETHAIDIAAPPEKIFAAIRAVTADEIFLFRTLTAIRRGGAAAPESILNVPPNTPLLDVATRTTFRYVADDPPREIVIGTAINKDAFAAMNFRLEGSTLITETRVHARTAAVARVFAIYWRIIHPGSDIIRRSWLRAIRRRAERPDAR